MKIVKLFCLTLTICFSFQLNAQQGINYKAVVKDGSGNVIANDLIVVQFTILQGVAETNVYQETFTPTTDANGLVILNIGEGPVVSGVFGDIDWGSDTHALKVEINTGGGLVDMGTSVFKTVPYAISALNTPTKLDDLSDVYSKFDVDSSLFLGELAGQNDDGQDNHNMGIGLAALNANITGRDNLAIGELALVNNTGDANTAIGQYTLLNNSGGNNNTAIGFSALDSNLTGNNNTATGHSALGSNLTGNDNTATGYQALLENTEGSRNTATGDRALNRNTTGNNNTAIGSDTMVFNTEGLHNVAIGLNALFNNTTGDDNVAIGSGAGLFGNTGSNNITIGRSANVPSSNGSDQVRIGNTDISYAGIQVAWTVTSDVSWKKDVRELPYGLDMISKLKPVDYIRKNNDKETREMGFIAQDVKQVLKDLGYVNQGFHTTDDEGKMSMRYNDFIAVLTKAIQEQHELIKSQSDEIKALQENQTLLKSLIERVENLEVATKE